MSAGSVSLESAIRTCKVDTAYANKVESDRFLNPNNMVCPVWNGRDLTGRNVCPNTFMTKRAGCNSASDRVDVENNVSRPQYMEYVTLDSGGIKGNIYGTMASKNSHMRTKDIEQMHHHTGQFGNLDGKRLGGCSVNPYAQAMAIGAQKSREEQAAVHSYEAYKHKNSCGF
jgi:hypothetical protein